MRNFLSGCVLAVVAMFGASANATDVDELFFESIEGKWSGPGEVLAGKYKGTRFTCRLEGAVPGFVAGMKLDGACSMGIFSQQMKASVVRVGKTYQGEFNDGAEGNGLDIVSGAVVGDKVVFTLSRGELGGVMLAKMEGDEKMDVTISVQIDDYYVPLIGMKLKKDVNNKARIAENDKHLYK